LLRVDAKASRGAEPGSQVVPGGRVPNVRLETPARRDMRSRSSAGPCPTSLGAGVFTRRTTGVSLSCRRCRVGGAAEAGETWRRAGCGRRAWRRPTSCGPARCGARSRGVRSSRGVLCGDQRRDDLPLARTECRQTPFSVDKATIAASDQLGGLGRLRSCSTRVIRLTSAGRYPRIPRIGERVEGTRSGVLVHHSASVLGALLVASGAGV